MVPSVLKGDVAGVSFHGVNPGTGEARQDNDLPLQLVGDAKAPSYVGNSLDAGFTYRPGLVRPASQVTFTAKDSPGASYEWFFGDGTTAEGRVVHHSFPDAEGTLLDGSGRFRVLLHARGKAGAQAWSSQPVVVGSSSQQAQPSSSTPVLSGLTPVEGDPKSDEGLVRVPADGGYTFTLLSSTTASLTIDGLRGDNPALRPQVCGSPGNAVQPIRVSAVLAAGFHRIQIRRGPESENAEAPGSDPDRPLLLWEGPDIPLQPVPGAALFHAGN